jgi:hypothetical protein
MKRTLIAVLIAGLLPLLAHAQSLASQITVIIHSVSKGPIIEATPQCLAGPHPEFCGKCAVDEPWCNAVFIITEDRNRTSAFLRFAVECSAFDRGGNLLGSGSSDSDGPDIPINKSTIDELKSFGATGSRIRIPNVKLADVARVECHAIGR